MSSIVACLRQILDGVAAEDADPVRAARQRGFIAGQLAAGLLALVVFVLKLAIAGTPSMAEAVVFAWLGAPLLVAVYAAGTRHFEAAELLSACALTGLVTWVALGTGGLASPAIIWLAVVPMEAAQSGSRKVAALGTLAAALGLAVLSLGPASGGAPAAWYAVSVLAALFYAGGLALRLDAVHRRAEGAAAAGEARYRLLAEHATDLITRHGASGEALFVSPAARTLVGAAPATLLGDGLLARVHIADRPAYLTALSRARTTGTEESLDLRLWRSENGGEAGRFAWVEMRCRSMPGGPDGPGLAVVAVFRDVAERKRNEAELLAARELAEQASAAKSSFLAHMSHELRTPLNAVIGFAELLKGDAGAELPAERRRDYARLIHMSGEHLLQVVNSILDMSKIEAGKFDIVAEPFALAPLAEGCVELMEGQAAERSLRLVRQIPADLPDLAADPRACRQILLNLLSNAIKFSKPGGSVIVGARAEGDRIAMFVRDTGIGIAAEDLPRLGTPFMQAERSYGRTYDGTGLGLSVVKGLAALHGGSLAIDSELGRGTTVTVRLPAAATAGGWAGIEELKRA